MKTFFCSNSKIPSPKQPLVVINKKDNCAKVVKTGVRKFVKGISLPVGTLVGATVGVAYGAFSGFCVRNYNLTTEFFPGKPPCPSALGCVWLVGIHVWGFMGVFNACKGALLLFPEYGTLAYNVTNKGIDSAFGKYKAVDSSQNKDSLNVPISQNEESKSQKTKGELDQNDLIIKENAARKIQAFVKPKILKTSEIPAALNVSK